MSDIRLYINGNEVDTDQSGVDVTVTYSIEAIQSGKIKGAHSKRNVNLPPTKGNIEIFENFEDPGSISTNAYKFLPARLDKAGLPVLTGTAKLDSVEVQATPNGFLPVSYKVGLFGNNADWKATVGNQLVRSLGWGQVTISTTEIESNADPLVDEFAWTLVKWKAWQNENRVQHSEFSPAVFVWQILKKAFEAQGYQLNSPFINDPFNRLVIPLGLNLDADFFRDFVNLRASSFGVIGITGTGLGTTDGVFIEFTDETTEPNFDNGNNYTGGIYMAPITALYNIILEISISATGDVVDPSEDAEVIIAVYKNGVQVAEETRPSGRFTLNINNRPILIDSIDDLNEGDEIEIYIGWVNIENIEIEIEGSLTINAEKESFELGEVYDLQFLIPSSWYVLNIIEDLTFIFNLAWETDVAGQQVYAYPKDDYYLSYRQNATGEGTTSGYDGFFRDDSTYDLQTRELYGGEVKLIDGYKRNTILAYSTDDETTNAEEQRRGVNIYSGGYQFPQDRFEDGIEFLYTRFFAKTIQINDVPITSGGMFGVQVPLIFGDNYNESPSASPNYYLAPRLLYYAGRRGGDDGYVTLYNTTTSASSAFDYPASFVTNYLDSSARDWSLSFSDESTNYLQVVPGLFKTMHLQEFKRREIGKLFTTGVKWNLNDITNLSFRRKGIIGSSRFLIQEINYNPKSNSPSKTVILYDERPNVTDLDKVTNTISLAGANPQPGTVTGSGSGLVGAGGTTVNIQLSRTLFLEHNSVTLTLAANSGITSVSNTAANVYVYQNGQKMIQDTQYTISGNVITIVTDAHWDGANYEVIVNGVTKG